MNTVVKWHRNGPNPSSFRVMNAIVSSHPKYYQFYQRSIQLVIDGRSPRDPRDYNRRLLVHACTPIHGICLHHMSPTSDGHNWLWKRINTSAAKAGNSTQRGLNHAWVTTFVRRDYFKRHGTNNGNVARRRITYWISARITDGKG